MSGETFGVGEVITVGEIPSPASTAMLLSPIGTLAHVDEATANERFLVDICGVGVALSGFSKALGSLKIYVGPDVLETDVRVGDTAMDVGLRLNRMPFASRVSFPLVRTKPVDETTLKRRRRQKARRQARKVTKAHTR